MKLVKRINAVNKSEFRDLIQVLTDFDACVEGAWMLAGSLSYRIFGEFSRTHRGVRDIDLVLLPNNNRDSRVLLSPTIQNHFLVKRIGATNDGYYYKMQHLQTAIEMDVFTGVPGSQCEAIRLGSLPILACTLEDQLFYFLGHLLLLDAKQRSIDKKPLFTATQLWNRVNEQKLFELVRRRHAELVPYLPEHLINETGAPLVDYVLSLQTRTALTSEQPAKKLFETVHGIRVVPHQTLKLPRHFSFRRSVTNPLWHRLHRLSMKFRK